MKASSYLAKMSTVPVLCAWSCRHCPSPGQCVHTQDRPRYALPQRVLSSFPFSSFNLRTCFNFTFLAHLGITIVLPTAPTQLSTWQHLGRSQVTSGPEEDGWGQDRREKPGRPYPRTLCPADHSLLMPAEPPPRAQTWVGEQEPSPKHTAPWASQGES